MLASSGFPKVRPKDVDGSLSQYFFLRSFRFNLLAVSLEKLRSLFLFQGSVQRVSIHRSRRFSRFPWFELSDGTRWMLGIIIFSMIRPTHILPHSTRGIVEFLRSTFFFFTILFQELAPRSSIKIVRKWIVPFFYFFLVQSGLRYSLVHRRTSIPLLIEWLKEFRELLLRSTCS